MCVNLSASLNEIPIMNFLGILFKTFGLARFISTFHTTHLLELGLKSRFSYIQRVCYKGSRTSCNESTNKVKNKPLV